MARHPAASDKEMIRDAFRGLLRFKKRAALFFIVTMAVVVAGICFAQREYHSEAILFLRIGRESVTLDPTATTGPTVGLNESRETEIESARQLLTSRAICERVVDEFGPDFVLTPPSKGESEARSDGSIFSGAWQWTYQSLTNIGMTDPVSKREKAILELKDLLTSGVREGTSIIEVGCDSTTPEHAQALLQAVLDEFLSDHQRAHRSSGSFDFFSTKTKESRAELLAADAKLRDLKNDASMLSIDGRRDGMQAQINAVEMNQLTTHADLIAARQRLESLADAMKSMPKTVVVSRNEGLANEAADEMRQQLYELEIRQQELLASRTADHPLVQSVAEQVHEAKRILGTQIEKRENWTTAPNPVRQPLEIQFQEQTAQAAALQAKLGQLQDQQEKLLVDSKNLNERVIQISQLEREVALLEDAYQAHAASLEHARVDQGMDTSELSNVNIIQPPSLSEKPIRPRKLLSLLAGFVAACLGSLAVVYLSTVWDDRLRSPEEIEAATDLPVLASVGFSRPATPRKAR